MGFLFGNEKRMTYSELNNFTWTNTGRSIGEDYLLKESTYNKCIKYNAESVAKCPIRVTKNLIDHDCEVRDRLSLRMNKFTNSVEGIKTLIAIGEHKGMSALYIGKDGYYPCVVNQLLIDDAGKIDTIGLNNVGYYLEFNGKLFTALEDEVVVYKSGISFDGIHSSPVQEYLKNTIYGNVKAQRYLNTLYDNGMCSKVVISCSSALSSVKDIEAKQSEFNKLYNADGRTFVVPAGYDVKSLNSSLADSQFAELRSIGRKEIASIFGLTSSMINEDTSNQNDLEKDTLRYIQDTLEVKLQSLEQEFNFKLLTEKERQQGIKIWFDRDKLIMSNPVAKAEILEKYSKLGDTINESRAERGKPPIPNGDTCLFPSGQVTMDAILNGDTSYLKSKDKESQTKDNNNLEGGENKDGNKEE